MILLREYVCWKGSFVARLSYSFFVRITYLHRCFKFKRSLNKKLWLTLCSKYECYDVGMVSVYTYLSKICNSAAFMLRISLSWVSAGVAYDKRMYHFMAWRLQFNMYFATFITFNFTQKQPQIVKSSNQL
jgi:hypothetical protein